VYTLPIVKNLIRISKSKIWLLLWLIIFALALAWRAQNLDAFGLSNDEGAHLMWARLTVDGYPLYSETRAVQSPLFLEAVGLAFRLAGQTIQAGRWAMLLGFSLLAVALSWLAYRAGGWLTALVAMFLLGISPLIFTFSRLVMAEVPATGLAVVSLAWCFVYLDQRHWGWLFASGLALGLSFITKALNPFVAAPVGLLLLIRHFGVGQNVILSYRVRGLIFDGLLWSVGVIIPLAVLPFIYKPVALYNQLVAFRSDLRATIPSSWPDTHDQFVIFFKSHWGFWLLALAGIVSAILYFYLGKKRRDETQNEARSHPWRMTDEFSLAPLPLRPPALYPLTWTVWLIAGTVMLFWHTPLFPHHFIVLLPPLTLLVAGFISDIVILTRYSRWALVLWLVVAAAIANLPAMARANQETAAIITGGRETEALELLKAVSSPNDFIMGDSQLLIFMADRRTPPPLGDVALVAIKAGRQTSARMIGLTEQYQAPAVVQWSLRLPWLPEYLAWVEANYLARRVWDNDHIIYFTPRFPAGQPVPNQRLARLGDSLALRGYELKETSVEPGHHLNLKVYWQTDVPLSQDYTIFTQLLDSSGTLAAGWDRQPLGGYFPTSQWPADEMITDVVQFPLPPDLSAGDYTLITGMYLLETSERLPSPDGRDYIVLATISVE
jgi:4-amino-4-deoxy-L-arabinose transferase-like glycosyltransferase